MKRLLAAIMAALSVLLLSIPTTATNEGVKLLIETKEDVIDTLDVLIVTIRISENLGFCRLELSLRYDKTLLTYLETAVGELFLGDVVEECSDGDSGVKLLAASTTPIIGDGVLWTISFTVQEAAAQYEIRLADVKVYDESSQEIPFWTEPLFVKGVAGSNGLFKELEGATDDGIDEHESSAQSEVGDNSYDEFGSDAALAVSFPDVQGHWGDWYAKRAVALGLLTGFEDGCFHPNEAVTRGQFVTLLWNMAGKPFEEVPAPFKDVPEEKEYCGAIAWAYAQGYIKGRSNEIFDPDSGITRQEAIKILFAFTGGVSGMEMVFTSIYDDGFIDSDQLAEWAKPAMYWSYYNGIINGKNTTTTLCPLDIATRVELAKVLVIFSEMKYNGD